MKEEEVEKEEGMGVAGDSQESGGKRGVGRESKESYVSTKRRRGRRRWRRERRSRR